MKKRLVLLFLFAAGTEQICVGTTQTASTITRDIRGISITISTIKIDLIKRVARFAALVLCTVFIIYRTIFMPSQSGASPQRGASRKRSLADLLELIKKEERHFAALTGGRYDNAHSNSKAGNMTIGNIVAGMPPETQCKLKSYEYIYPTFQDLQAGVYHVFTLAYVRSILIDPLITELERKVQAEREALAGKRVSHKKRGVAVFVGLLVTTLWALRERQLHTRKFPRTQDAISIEDIANEINQNHGIKTAS